MQKSLPLCVKGQTRSCEMWCNYVQKWSQNSRFCSPGAAEQMWCVVCWLGPCLQKMCLLVLQIMQICLFQLHGTVWVVYLQFLSSPKWQMILLLALLECCTGTIWFWADHHDLLVGSWVGFWVHTPCWLFECVQNLAGSLSTQMGLYFLLTMHRWTENFPSPHIPLSLHIFSQSFTFLFHFPFLPSTQLPPTCFTSHMLTPHDKTTKHE